MLVYCLTLVFPIAFVAHNVLQIFIALYIFGTYNLRRVSYHLFRDSCLPGDFNGKRRAGLTYGELEQGLHVVAVVKHCAVYYIVVAVGKVLQILIVCCNNSEYFSLAELLQHGFGYGPANLWLGSTAKLVYQQQRSLIAVAHHLLHVCQMA